MENQKSNSNLKAIIIVLALLLVGSLFYIYTLTSEATKTHLVLETTKSEKESVMKDLAELKSTYDAAIAEKTTLSDELIAERDKVIKLMSDLKKSKGDAAAMSKYKSQFLALQTKMNSLITENETLKKQNTTLTVQRDSTAVVLGESKKFNEVLVGQNEELAKTVEKGSKLAVLNLKTAAYIVRGSGKQIETAKAGKADVLKISFTIAENAIAKSGDKTYYVQVIDSKTKFVYSCKRR
jgi:myosin heavy subunit